ncbi:protein FAR-RED IMPAIRED RESPONSE 1-like [Hevea brasiliensis]|uniref:protein FAR-RED IMPAIRED RESPONSE 1-like n=1 Tax=Hevea brasiliensis TaxID=3981 RepID=UPI0025D18629|nr:protein FAR-RED IMPAIRED RESPONSE 1-like [Hevea brasiliensis]
MEDMNMADINRVNRRMIIQDVFGCSEDDNIFDEDGESFADVEMNPSSNAFSNAQINHSNESFILSIEEGPKKGMWFDSVDRLYEFYKEHTRLKGFSVAKRCASKGKGEMYRYQTIYCDKGRRPDAEKFTKRINCPVWVNAVLRDNGLWEVTKIISEHNHELDPSTSRLLEVQAGGPENLSCIPKDIKNFIESNRRSHLEDGDVEAIRSLFVTMQKKDGNFFYTIRVDNENRLSDVFWVHSRGRAVYEEFHYVVSFDTTYLVNRYKMPFATIVGVNHHDQSILLGCALVAHEDAETFRWLFNAWLEAMGGIHPTAILTDQCEAIRRAIREVMPNTRHRFCLWHILCKVPEKFQNVADFGNAVQEFKAVIYDSLSIEMFESNWTNLKTKYGLETND